MSTEGDGDGAGTGIAAEIKSNAHVVQVRSRLTSGQHLDLQCERRHRAAASTEHLNLRATPWRSARQSKRWTNATAAGTPAWARTDAVAKPLTGPLPRSSAVEVLQSADRMDQERRSASPRRGWVGHTGLVNVRSGLRGTVLHSAEDELIQAKSFSLDPNTDGVCAAVKIRLAVHAFWV